MLKSPLVTRSWYGDCHATLAHCQAVTNRSSHSLSPLWLEAHHALGHPTKQVRDPQLHQVTVHRYRCCRCHCSFRVYPAGVDRATQTLRLRHLAALRWALVLRLRSVVAVFAAFGTDLSRMSVWRDGQALVEQVRTQRHAQRVRVLGLDGTGSRVGGQPTGISVAVDLGTGVDRAPTTASRLAAGN